MKLELIKQLITEFDDSKVTKMKVEIDDLKLELEKNGKTVVQQVEPQEVIQSATTNKQETLTGTPVKSPIVGVFYPASSPDSDPFVHVGDQVKKGPVLCIVEAMKVMNEIKAPIDGTVTSILVKHEDLVEFDQVLMMIE